MEPKNDDLDRPQGAEMVQPREPWERKPDESRKAYDAFSRYRDSEKRSFKAIADALNCSTQNIFQWSARHNWKIRCDACDLEQDRLQRAEFARNQVRMRERHVAVARAMLHVAGYALKEWADKIEQRLPLHLEPEQIALLTKCAVELESRTTGAEGERRFATINVIFSGYESEEQYEAALSGRKYDSKQAGEARITREDFEREQYERLSDDERRNMDAWKNPPKPKQFN